MNTHNLRLAAVMTAAFLPSLAWAQREHQPAATQASSAELTQCLRVQPVIDNIITAATSRAEAARLSNSPSDMRAAVEALEAALRDIRAQSAPCSAAATGAAPHAAHTMPSAGPAATTAPASPRPTSAKPDSPHAGHSAAPAATTRMDPVNGLMVDPARAPKTTYRGRPYYFSSDQSRREFLQNPAKFAKQPRE
jgi:YHS domain-containing protein